MALRETKQLVDLLEFVLKVKFNRAKKTKFGWQSQIVVRATWMKLQPKQFQPNFNRIYFNDKFYQPNFETTETGKSSANDWSLILGEFQQYKYDTFKLFRKIQSS